MPRSRGSKFVDWFRSASPYIHVHRGRTVVVHFGDSSVQSEDFNNLVHDLALLHSLGIRLLIVFDVAGAVAERMRQAAIEPRAHGGLPITDGRVLEILKGAAGQLLIEIQARLSMGLANTPMSNAEVRVTSGNFVTAKPLGVVDGVDLEFSGAVRNIDVKSIRTNLEGHEIVLIPPVGYSVTGEAFSLEARELAAQLAIEIGADKLVYLMEAEGIAGANGKLLREVTHEDGAALLAQIDPRSEQGIYLRHAVHACGKGVRRVHLIDRRVDGAILRELFTRDGTGTMVSLSSFDEIRKARPGDIGGILELVEPLEKDGTLVERSREHIELDLDHYNVLVRDGVIIGCAALYPFSGDSSAELACLAVHPDYHERGRGEQLLTAAEKDAQRAKAKQLFVLTTRAEHWFLERGFVETAVESLPVARQQLYNFQRNSKVLVKKL